MAGTSEILQEYLISLGYETDELSLKKFERHMGTVGKTIFKVGAGVAGVIASVEAASAKFAYSMRRIYFESELADSSVENLNALSFAGKQIGVSGGAMASAVHDMAQAIRLNPGLQGLIESFGVRVTGRDMSDVAVDLVNALRKLPEFVGVKYASLFGIDPNTYHQMIKHMDTLQQKRRQLLNVYRETGYNPDLASNKKTILEYTQSLDLLEARLGILGQALLIKFAPAFHKFNDVISESVTWWTQWSMGVQHLNDVLDNLSMSNVWGFIKEDLLGIAPPAHMTKGHPGATGSWDNEGWTGSTGVSRWPKNQAPGLTTGTAGTVPQSVVNRPTVMRPGALPDWLRVHPSSTTKLGGGAGSSGGGHHVEIDQSTTIHVTGGNASETADAVAAKQHQLNVERSYQNTEVLRNLKGSVR
jgi:hypothetical protein